MDKTFKDLISDIKCGNIAPIAFTEDDLAKVKLCIPEPKELPTSDLKIAIPDETSCVNDGIDSAKKILIDQLKKQEILLEASLLKGKVQEALDHYRFIARYYQVRVEFINETLSAVENFTSQHLYWSDEFNRLSKLKADYLAKVFADSSISSKIKSAIKNVDKLSDSNILAIVKDSNKLSTLLGSSSYSAINGTRTLSNYLTIRSGLIESKTNRELSKKSGNVALTKQIEKVPILSETYNVKADILSASSQFSGQLIPNFEQSGISLYTGVVAPPRTLVFGVRIIDLDSTVSNIPVIKDNGTVTQSKKVIKIKDNPLLKYKPFKSTQATYCTHINYDKGNKPKQNYDYVPGALYNKTSSGYDGLYRKLANPISFLFSPEERGLSLDSTQIDPSFKDIQNAQISVKEGDLTLYIKNREKYESFYERLEENLPKRIKKEKEEVFPVEIADGVKKLETIALQEVVELFKQSKHIVTKLVRPVSYKAANSDIFTQGEFKYSEVDKILSDNFAYYKKAADQLNDLISECVNEIENLDKIINVSSMNSDAITKAISNIPCFKSAVISTNPDCEAEARAMLGTDPLSIRTIDGTDSSLPDMNNPCYWKEFAKSLSKVSLLPFPDLTSQLFRYYPINNMIPTPIGIVMLPVPQKWTTIFSLSTSVGTLVAFLAMPIAIVGIPLPSVYLFYFSPDGRKYLLLAPNFPMLYSNTSFKYGFEVDDSMASQNQLGLNPSNPYQGQLVKGSLNIPLALSAKSDKATRVATASAKVALSQNIPLINGAGLEIGKIDPSTYIQKYLTINERILKGIDHDPMLDFEKQVNEFKRSISRQFNRLGEMQLQAVSVLKEETRRVRDAAVREAEKVSNLKDRRELKKKVRDLDPIELDQKVKSVLSDFEKYIDKIKLGTIKFPDDPTKLNPKLPAAITGLQPILEKASKGELIKDKDSTNFLAKLRRMAAQVDVTALTTRKVFNLNKSDDFIEFKETLQKYANEAVSYLKGTSSPIDKIQENLTADQVEAINKASALRKKRVAQALAFTSLSVTVPTLKLFDPSAPCCKVDENLTDLTISPQVTAIVATFNTLFESFLNGITIESLRSLLGDTISNISVSTISGLFDSILEAFPPLILPDKPDLLAISQAVLIPILTAIHIPQAPNPLGILFPAQVTIPLDAIVKPLLKAAIAYLLELLLRMLSDASQMLVYSDKSTSDVKEIIKTIPCGDSHEATVSTMSNSNTVNITLPGGISIKLPKIPTIPLDIVNYFSLLTSTDLLELIKSLIFAAIDGILNPLKKIVKPIISLTKSLKDLSFNIIEASNPFILPLKLAMMAIQLSIPNSLKLKLANFDAIDAIKRAYLPAAKATEPVLKEVNYLAALSACAFGSFAGVQLARAAASPFFNQDDLPPWERLTHKNPLFAIFLDEIAWRTSLMSTGSLIFKTKMPGLYPANAIPNVIIDTGRHIS